VTAHASRSPHPAVDGRPVELRALADAIRDLIDATVTTDAPASVTADTARRVDELTAMLRAHTPETPYPRFVGTVDAIQRELCRDGFVLRYPTDESDDGLPPGEGAFLPCSFWLVDALLMIGRRAEAERLFHDLLGVRNDLGLLAEEYDPAEKRLLGNFPQAFTHVGLVNSAYNLSQRDSPHRQRPRRV
jgi:hypothetical protein